MLVRYSELKLVGYMQSFNSFYNLSVLVKTEHNQTGKSANCASEIWKIYNELYREHQNCMPEFLVARYKLSRLGAQMDL